jgi:type VI secretion system secreted protein Hcp
VDQKNFGGLLLACALVGPLPAAADDIFLRLTDVRGESVDARHKGEIDVISYSQSMTGPFAPATPGGAAAGKPACGLVTLTKYVDLSSPDLILYALNGRHIANAVFTFRKPGQAPVEYYTVKMEDVIVTQVEQTDSRSGASQRAVEKVSLMGRKFDFEYTAQQPDGSAGFKPKAGWDCVANTKR